MTKHHIEKPVLLEKIREANFSKKYVIDKIASQLVTLFFVCHPIIVYLTLSLCISIEMVWNQLKHHVWHLNIYTSQPAKVIDLLRNVCDQQITKGHWENYVGHVTKQKKEFWEMDHIIDNKIGPLVIHLSDNNDSNRSEEELLWRNQENKNCSL